MSIYAYVGLPGSGKSYNAVANVILPALKEGRTVVTNVPLNMDKVRSTPELKGTLVEFPIDQVKQDPELMAKFVTPGCIFVFDECWKLWPAGDKANKIADIYKTLIAEHRHMVDAAGNSVHIVLLVQDLANVAMFARRLVEQTFVHTKLGHLGQEGRFRVDIYHGFMTGVVGSPTNRIRDMFGSYQAEVWDFYKSHTLTQSAVAGANEKSTDRRGNVFKRPIFTIVMPLMLVAAGFAVWKLIHNFHEMAKPPDKAVPTPSAAHPGFVDTVRPSQAGIIPTIRAPAKPRYRVMGAIEVPGDPARGKAILQDDSGHRIFRSISHCRVIDADYFECEIDGEWYGSAGTSLVASVDGPLAVSVPTASQAAPPLSQGGATAASVASAVPAQPTGPILKSRESPVEFGPPLPNRAATAALRAR